MTLFEQILQTNIINFIIVISTLVLIFKKAHLGDLIEKMAEDVKNSVEKSSKDAQGAIEEYKSTKRATKDTPLLQDEIMLNAKANAQNIKEKIDNKTKVSQAEIRASIQNIYESQKERFKNATVAEIYGACIDMAKNEIIKKLDNTLQKKLIDISIDELDKIEGNLS